MAIADTVKQDLATAMKAGEKDRVGALRLVLSELQKAEKAGDGDELEAQLIAAYLPAELSDEDLRAIVRAAIEEAGATSTKDMGMVMKAAMPKVGGRADGKRVSALVQECLA
jgi:uncharacterized protein YqeY